MKTSELIEEILTLCGYMTMMKDVSDKSYTVKTFYNHCPTPITYVKRPTLKESLLFTYDLLSEMSWNK